ncbi:MAG: sulfatase [Planctomycetaceae bacterium]|nr:sulfatase [Planctomycetaceae bacterium]
MNCYSTWKLLFGVIGILCILSNDASDALAAKTRPNVLLIITDEHNFRTLGCYRDLMPREQAEMWGLGAVVPTPNFDRLAKEGVICTRAYATAPVCSPCRAAMITGRYPHMTGVVTNNLVLDRTIPTLADRLNDAGYRTAFMGKWHLGGNGKPEWQPKVDGGFRFTKFMFNRGHWKKFDIKDGKPFIAARKGKQPTYGVDGANNKTFSTDWLTDRAIDFITNKDAKEPFFTVISYPDPHGPNTVRAPYDQRFDDLPFRAPRTYRSGKPSPKWLGPAKKHPVFRGNDMSRYFGMVQCLDDNIGRLLSEMDEAGRLENTLIVMTSDHGDLCYEHDRLNKGNPYEGSARVPMIFRHPKLITADQVYTDPVGTVDLTPTVMGLLSLDSNPKDQGRDLSSKLSGKQETQPDVRPITFLRNSGTKPQWLAAIDARFKLIISVNDEPWLFDNRKDPDELENAYHKPEMKADVERLAKALCEYGTQMKDPHLANEKIAASLQTILGAKTVCQSSE